MSNNVKKKKGKKRGGGGNLFLDKLTHGKQVIWIECLHE